jgi:hypothetical protein
MNTDKTNGLPNSSLIRVHPCNPWLTKPSLYFEQKETEVTKVKTKKTCEMKGFLRSLRFLLFKKTEPLFFNRITGFLRIIMINPNPVNPEKSCNPVQKTEPINSPRRTRRARRYEK